jgi:hypothetical protein
MLIKATDKAFRGITTNILNIPTKFTALGHAVVSNRQWQHIKANFDSFLEVDREIEAPDALDAPATDGVYHGDNLVKVVSTSLPFDAPVITNQITSSPHGPVSFDHAGFAHVPPHIAEFFSQIPHAFQVHDGTTGNSDPAGDLQAATAVMQAHYGTISEAAQIDLDAVNRATAPKLTKKVLDKMSKEAIELANARAKEEADDKPEPSDEGNQEGEPEQKVSLESEGAHMSEQEKALRAMPPVVLRKHAQKLGVEPFGGKTVDDIIKEILAKG